jgi:hypothetical protein
MTKAEREHYDRIASMGCIACRKQGHKGTSAEVHHIRETAGMGKRSHYTETIPLCPAHHRGTMHPIIPSIHLDRSAFVAIYGDEMQLLDETRRLLNDRIG